MGLAKTPQQDELNRLHAEGLTNQQIADMFGVTAKYVSRKRQRATYHKPKPLLADPREFLPKEAPLITDEAVRRWRVSKECLCGCGQSVTMRSESHPKYPELVAGVQTFFRRGHNRAMMPKGSLGGTPRPADAIRRSRESILQRSISTMGVSFVIDDYLERTGKSLRTLAQELNCSSTWLAEIRAGSKKTIRKSSAVKILKHLGEPIPMSLVRDARVQSTYEQRKENRDRRQAS